MTVQELINELEKVEDKEQDVTINEIDTDYDECSVSSITGISNNVFDDGKSVTFETRYKKTRYRYE